MLDDPLDIALARLEECPPDVSIRSRLTALAFGWRPIFTATWVILPLAVDAVTTATGVAGGAAAGFTAAAALTPTLDAGRVRQHERMRGMRLYTWPTSLRRRYCNMPCR